MEQDSLGSGPGAGTQRCGTQGTWPRLSEPALPAPTSPERWQETSRHVGKRSDGAWHLAGGNSCYDSATLPPRAPVRRLGDSFACSVGFTDKHPEITGQDFTKLIGNCSPVTWGSLASDFGAVLQGRGEP